MKQLIKKYLPLFFAAGFILFNFQNNVYANEEINFNQQIKSNDIKITSEAEIGSFVISAEGLSLLTSDNAFSNQLIKTDKEEYILTPEQVLELQYIDLDEDKQGEFIDGLANSSVAVDFYEDDKQILILSYSAGE